MTPKYEKLIAVGLFVFLVASVVFVVGAVFAFGYEWLNPAAPVLRWHIVAFGNAIFLYVICWTDLPQEIRRSGALRRQVQCLTIWQAVLGVMALITLARAGYFALFSMFGPAVALLAYSGGVTYRALKSLPL
ncbi:MAG TPA: hypothetical protein VEC38_03555 [Candidatus Binataceae bacterium]|nr:hypothetical protein [Candidatus Binataceae bacterium]